MYLSKWYGDCVTPDGRAFIAYWARLGPGWVRVPYAAALEATAGGGTAQRTAVRPSPEPAPAEGDMRWACAPLGFRAAWLLGPPTPAVTLFESDAGAIRWHCAVPGAPVRIERPGGATLTGSGYLEHLLITLPLRKLPMTGLRWGRFVSAGLALAWIVWQGETPRTWVFRDGAIEPGARVTDDGIALADGGRLTIENAAVIREGPLGVTALRRMRALRLLTPRRLWSASERKWLARGTVALGAQRHEGWVIHEVVRWA